MTEINKQPTTEAGRSMVEMLGTLAIIGVLSIGGIAGYTYAMNKSKANDILDGVSKRAVVVSQQMILGNTPSLVEYAGKKIGDYSVTLDNTRGDGFFGIQISGVEKSVCERLQGQGLVNAADIYLGDAYFDESTCSEGNGNVLTYVFNDTLNVNAVASEGANGGDDEGVCTSGIVKVYDCSTKTTTDCCLDNGNTCEQPICRCSGDGDCPGQQTCQDGSCSCPLDLGGYSGRLAGDGQTCCNTDDMPWNGTNYSGVNIAACGCPLFGEVVNGTTCCRNGWTTTSEGFYDGVNIAVCGCPDNGDFTEGVCCKNSEEWRGDGYYPIEEPGPCGCPDYGELVEGVCCKNGNEWMGDDYYDNGIGVCGCPDGGTKVGEDCCLDNYLYGDGDGYNYADPTICGGCPEGGENIDGVCCKDGKEWCVGDYACETEYCS